MTWKCVFSQNPSTSPSSRWEVSWGVATVGLMGSSSEETSEIVRIGPAGVGLGARGGGVDLSLVSGRRATDEPIEVLEGAVSRHR